MWKSSKVRDLFFSQNTTPFMYDDPLLMWYPAADVVVPLLSDSKLE